LRKELNFLFEILFLQSILLLCKFLYLKEEDVQMASNRNSQLSDNPIILSSQDFKMYVTLLAITGASVFLIAFTLAVYRCAPIAQEGSNSMEADKEADECVINSVLGCTAVGVTALTTTIGLHRLYRRCQTGERQPLLPSAEPTPSETSDRSCFQRLTMWATNARNVLMPPANPDVFNEGLHDSTPDRNLGL